MKRGAVAALVLVCACGAVNVFIYTYSGSPSLRYIQGSTTGGRAPVTCTEIPSESRKDDHVRRQNINGEDMPRKVANSTNSSLVRIFTFLINNATICSQQTTWDMVVVVISDVKNVNRRQTIRNTWASVAHAHNALVLFLVGNNTARIDQRQVDKEAELYNDVIQVDIIESYDNLTYKSIAMLQWLGDYCFNSRMYLKTDDDAFINIANAINVTRAITFSRWFSCFVFKGAPPNRNINSKWYTSFKEYNKRHFPTYCSGVAYVFPSSILTDLYYSSLKTDFLRMEDVFITGVAAERLHVKYIHNWGYSFTKRKPTGCAYSDVISGHEVTLRQMEIIFSQLMSREIDCETNENLTVKKAEEIL